MPAKKFLRRSNDELVGIQQSGQWAVGSGQNTKFEYELPLPTADCLLSITSTRRRHAWRIAQRPRGERRACGNEHVLASIEHVSDRRRSVKRGSHLKMPEQLACARIEREEIPFRVAAECQPRRRRQYASRRRTDVREFPFAFSRRRIDRAQRAPRAVVRSGGTLTSAAGVALTWNVFLLPGIE